MSKYKPIGETRSRGKKRLVYALADAFDKDGKPTAIAKRLAKEALARGEETPIFKTKDGKRLRVEPKGKGYSSWKDIDVKSVERGETNAKRADAIEKLTSTEDAAAGEIKRAQINKQGLEAHHGMPLEESRRGYDYIKETKGEDAANQWVKTQKDVGKPVGHHPDNLGGLTTKAHAATHSDERVYKKAINNAGSNPSVMDLVKNPTKNYPIYEVGGGVVKKVAPKLAGAAAKFVPVVGSALVFSELGQRAQAAERNPTALNQLQAGISSLEAAAEGASLAAYGSGIGAGLGVAADVVSLGLGLTNGAIDTVRDLVGSKRRTP